MTFTRRQLCSGLAGLAVLCAPAMGQVVISQIYGGGGNTGATYRNDFIELFNRGNAAVSLNGWSVQYSSAGGSFNAGTNLPNVMLNPGQYFLVQEASGGANGALLPTADATGAINMSGTAGKVALSNSTTLLGATCTGAAVVDLIGYGATANCSETSPAPAPSNTTADFRAQGGCQDTNANGTDFATGTPNPRNTATALNPCSTTGACCYATEQVCSIELQMDCTDAGGTYQGDNSTCAANICGFPQGACCNGRVCAVTAPVPCATGGGSYQGDGSTCTISPCLSCDTIADAKALATNTPTKICNVIIASTTDLVASAVQKNFTVQDASGGATIFGSNAEIDAILGSAAAGDSVDIQGVTTSFSGLFEISNPVLVVNHGPVGVPGVATTTGADYQDGAPNGEILESELVQLGCAQFTTAGNFAGGTNYTVTTAAGSVIVRVSTVDQDLVGTPIPTGPVDLVGIMSQFDATAPFDGGYELLLRTLSDIADPSILCRGACCFLGSCSIDTELGCMANSGQYQGNDTVCDPNPCPQYGACCLGVECVFSTNSDCTNASGNYQGDGSQCFPNPCASAACDHGDANCDGAVNNFDIDPFVYGILNNQAAYLATGATQACWDQRDCWGDINCDTAFNNFDIDPFVFCILHPPLSGGCPCIQACCFFGSGTCQMLAPTDCTNAGGTPMGDGSTCGTVFCEL